MAKNFHEEYAVDAMQLPSERSTGLVFTAVALIVAYLWRDHLLVQAIASFLAVSLLAASLLVPRLLKPLNILWFRLALLLNKVVSPVVMFVVFLLVIVPYGLVMQLIRDPLRKRRSPDAMSYWSEHKEQEVAGSMTSQF